MRTLLLILCLVIPSLGDAQKPKNPIPKIEIDSVEKITILDAYNDNYERVWGRKYVIEFHDAELRRYQLEEYYKNYEFDFDELDYDSMEIVKSKGISKSKARKMTKGINDRNKKRMLLKQKADSIIWGSSKRPENWVGKKDRRPIDKAILQEFFSKLSTKSLSPYPYLKGKGIDSIWLKKNEARLYEKWKEMFPEANDQTKREISLALKDFKLFRNTFFSILLSRNFTTYPYMEVVIEKKNQDSVLLTSRGQGFFQVPFEVNSRKLYNPEIAISISKLVPDEKFYSVSKRLNPKWEKIEKAILWKIGDAYRNKMRKKKKK